MKRKLITILLLLTCSLIFTTSVPADEELPPRKLETAVVRNASNEDLAPLHAEANEYSQVYFKYHTGVLVDVISRFADG